MVPEREKEGKAEINMLSDLYLSDQSILLCLIGRDKKGLQ
jgi:hypothetical protein